MKVSPDKKGFEQMSFPIEENLAYHYIHVNLYFSPEKKKFYALVNKTNPDDSASEVNIYSLNYPPRPVSAEEEPLQENNASGDIPFVLISVIAAAIAALGYVYFAIRKKKKNQDMPQQEALPVYENNKQEIIQEAVVEKDVIYYDFTKGSICFLGGFYVSDKSGENITGQFSPILKQLILLLILSTIKDPKGISGKKLIQQLWFDKSEESAKNNRNVYMSKLRAILENVGNVEITNNNGFWRIELNEVRCDYSEAMGLFSKFENAENIDSSEVSRLLELLLRGTLLPNTEVDWIDGFKSDFSNLTVDLLKHLVRNDSYNLSSNLKLKIADTIFLHDYINEDALYLKCSILYNSGKKGIAKTVYDNFTKEYQSSLGVTYKYSLQDVISMKNVEN